MKMMNCVFRSLIFLLGICLTCLYGVESVLASYDLSQDDLKGSKDIPGLPRYEGSVISGYRLAKYDEAVLPIGPWKEEGGWKKSIKKAGRRTRIIYLAPRDRSSTEVMLNYTMALKKIGYETLFECSGHEACGNNVGNFYADDTYGDQLTDTQLQEYAFSPNTVKNPEIFTGKATIKGQDSYIFIFAAFQDNFSASAGEAKKRVGVFVEEIRSVPMEDKMVTLKASDLDKQINEQGKAAIYGILFDSNRAVIKAESRPQIEEMAKYIAERSKVSVYIVGHTDNRGSLKYNLDLSQRRAQAVVFALADDFGINKERLTAYGVADLAPVTSNGTDAGQAKNRRVEMVLK